jgi:hypothetical protein
MQGLKMVRRFRRFTFWTRYPASLLVLGVNHVMRALHFRKSSKRKTLLWTKESDYRPRIGETMIRLTTKMQHLPFQQPKVEDEMDAVEVLESKEMKEDV